MTKKIRIAIDGPSGAGKSTIAKLVAARLGIDYIDTGAMYRAIGYKMRRDGISADDQEALARMLDQTDIDFSEGNIILDGEIINEEIRVPEISKMASVCSAIGSVREKLVSLQRKMAANKSVIMDGRDIGSNVLTDAEYKFFLTASVDERAERRYKELAAKGNAVSLEQVAQDILQRDHSDMTRELNPLCKAEDAAELDSTGLSIEEVVEDILQAVEGSNTDAMILHEAIRFAAQAHNGQVRKETEIPYIVHPFEVVQILTEAGCETALLVAGLLHDTLEDTEITDHEIGERFGRKVLALVQSESEDKSKSWEERKQHTVDFLRQDATLDQMMLACADKLSNLRSIKADLKRMGDQLWNRFSRGKEKQRWYYGGLADALLPLEDYEMYQEFTALYKEIFE